MNLLVTGGAGFIGSHFIRYILSKYPDYTLVNLDALTYAGNVDRLSEAVDSKSYHFVHGDIRDEKLIDQTINEHEISHMVNLAAETHVDRSIDSPREFVQTNVLGTQILLDSARKHRVKKFIQISTDEVYGSLEGDGDQFTERSPLKPNNPYSSSKAAADLLTLSYYKTFKMDVNILRSSNNYGSYQFPEKLIPLMITNAISGLELLVYGDGENIRDWLHVLDNCRAIDLVLHKGKSGEIYNAGGNNERTNNQIVRLIIEKLNISETKIKYVEDRPGHDWRYSMDSMKIKTELRWKPEVNFNRGIMDTVEWYQSNEDWWGVLKE